MTSADYQRVAGWLALRFQNIQGPLYGLRVEYQFGFGGGSSMTPIQKPSPLSVLWRGGPTAASIAETLAQVSDPDMPVRYQPDPHGYAPVARLELSNVPVVLHSADPAPNVGVQPIGATPRWSWPNPMRDKGVARDSVLWQLPPDSGGVGEATVVRLPYDGIHDIHWRQEGFIVVDDEFTMPEYPSPDLQSLRRHCDEVADIRLRAAGDWSLDEADTWLEDQIRNPRGFGPAALTGVVFEDQCLLRWHRGLRILATQDRSRTPYWAAVSYLPSVIYGALIAVQDHHYPPSHLVVRAFGNQCDSHFDLHTDIATPAPR